jgi:carbonic anhydrase/acetyltransferase-like protein (isoleucine patch superfamily)
MSSASSIRRFEQHQPQVDASAWIDPSAVVIGQVEIGAEVSVWCNTVIRGDVNRVRIGAGSNIQDLCMLHVSTPNPPRKPDGAQLIIGERVSVGHQCILHGCTLHDEVLIGMGSLIMDHAEVQSHVIVGAGSLVPEGKVLESGHLYMGRPAKLMRTLTAEEMAYFPKLAAHYVKLARRHAGV